MIKLSLSLFRSLSITVPCCMSVHPMIGESVSGGTLRDTWRWMDITLFWQLSRREGRGVCRAGESLTESAVPTQTYCTLIRIHIGVHRCPGQNLHTQREHACTHRTFIPSLSQLPDSDPRTKIESTSPVNFAVQRTVCGITRLLYDSSEALLSVPLSPGCP